MTTREIIENTRNAKNTLLTMTSEEKNKALMAMADAIMANKAHILSANDQDMAAAKGRLYRHSAEKTLVRLRVPSS